MVFRARQYPEPGNAIFGRNRMELLSSYKDDAFKRIEWPIAQRESGSFAGIVDIVPRYIFLLASYNTSMFAGHFFRILFGIGLINPKKNHLTSQKVFSTDLMMSS